MWDFRAAVADTLTSGSQMAEPGVVSTPNLRVTVEPRGRPAEFVRLPNVMCSA